MKKRLLMSVLLVVMIISSNIIAYAYNNEISPYAHEDDPGSGGHVCVMRPTSRYSYSDPMYRLWKCAYCPEKEWRLVD